MTQTESHFIPDREQDFILYVIWKSLPRDIDNKLFEQLGVSDETILELSQIKTQKQFAEQYDLDTGTLTDWNKHIREGNIDPELKQLDWRYWAKQATPSVVSAVLRNLRKHGDAARGTWWMVHVEGYEPKSRHELTGADGANLFSIADLVAGAEKVLEEHGEDI
jgi:hypothetical protein